MKATSSTDIVEPLLKHAIRTRASDIHIEPYESRCVVRYRVDGQLKPWKQYDADQLSKVTTKLKVMAGMDITDKRLPQDGRFSLEMRGGKYDFRVSSSPMINGEKIVIRILHKNLAELDFAYLGYTSANLARVKQVLNRPNGLVLYCGPTGSGKTTSLYTAINYLNSKARNIQTIEDPVEGRIPGINQAQVNPEIGLTFATLLRSYLRQDCDVILLGEIRDEETAQLAVQASLTGHLILGTIHANGPSAALTRLTEMNVSRFFAGSSVTGVINQRLVRKLCLECKEAYSPADRVRRRFRLKPNARLYRAVGCPACAGTGFKGRLSIHEVLEVTDQIKDAVHEGVAEGELLKLARLTGMTSILSDGLSKALAGDTTVEEVTLVVNGVGVSADEWVKAELKRFRDTREQPRSPASTQPPFRRSQSSTDDYETSQDTRPNHSVPGLRAEERVVTGVLLQEGNRKGAEQLSSSANSTSPPRRKRKKSRSSANDTVPSDFDH